MIHSIVAAGSILIAVAVVVGLAADAELVAVVAAVDEQADIEMAVGVGVVESCMVMPNELDIGTTGHTCFLTETLLCLRVYPCCWRLNRAGDEDDSIAEMFVVALAHDAALVHAPGSGPAPVPAQ